jgi:hypothetical protein
MSMGKLIEFPTSAEVSVMPGHAVDLRRVVQLVRELVDVYGSDTEQMWDHFDDEIAERIQGYDGYDVENTDIGKIVTVMTNTTVGRCQFSILVYKDLLVKK